MACNCKGILIIRVVCDGEPPKYMTTGAAGFDIQVVSVIRHSLPESYFNASVERGNRGCLSERPVIAVIPPNHCVRFGTGIRGKLPGSWELDIKPRSSTFESGLMAEGTIDSDYTGEWCIIARNIGFDDIVVRRGDRIAQGVLRPAVQAFFDKTDRLEETERGENGFGHTGVS